MSGSARRIVAVGALFWAAALTVVGALVHTMLIQHPFWLERSYRNRWAFRDVPTRRGSICDRQGQVLVEDQPRFALDLDYDAFRRGHPAGGAIAAAAMLWPGAFSHQKPADVVAAGLRLLDLPVAELHADQSSRVRARDLRFYVTTLAAALSGRNRREVVRAVLAAVEAKSQASTVAVLGLSRDDLGRELGKHAARVHELAAGLRGDGLVVDLGALLDAQLARHLAQEGRPLATRSLTVRLLFEVAAAIACQQEAWSGFLLRPAVTRAPTPMVAVLPSLPSLLGQVSGAGAGDDDARRVHALAEDVVAQAQLSQVLPDDLELPDEAVDRLTQRAQNFLRQRVMLGGRFGRSGVEAAMELALAGQPGLRFVERDVRAREQLLYHTLDVNPGHDVRVTIDARMQEVLERGLDAYVRGLDVAMAVIDAATGDILAMGGRPMQITGQDGELVERAVSPAVSWRNAGHLGSLVKPFVLLEQLAAERSGAPHKPMAEFGRCEHNYKQIPGTGRWLACDEYHGDDGRDPALAIAKSCNVFFFQAAEGLGIDGLRRAYTRAGWIDLVGEGDAVPFQRAVVGVSGFSRPRVEPQGHALQHVGIGYGVKANVLSVARAYAALATGHLPTLGLIAGEARPSVDLAIPPADLALVQDGLRRCVTAGTARAVEGLAELGVSGKTGTAEVNEQDQNNAWFAGFVRAPNGRPTLAFAVVAYTVDEHGKESAGVVADFLRGLIEHQDGASLRRRWLEGVEDR